jgi:hypothetical protein
MKHNWRRPRSSQDGSGEFVTQRRVLLHIADDAGTSARASCCAWARSDPSQPDSSHWEFCSWREFRNGREVDAPAGLTPTPYQN